MIQKHETWSSKNDSKLCFQDSFFSDIFKFFYTVYYTLTSISCVSEIESNKRENRSISLN